jgi:hypothetical protein
MWLSRVLCIYLWLYRLCVVLGRLFSYLIYTQSLGLLWRGISPSLDHYLHTRTATQTQIKRTKTSVPRVGLKPTIPASKRAFRHFGYSDNKNENRKFITQLFVFYPLFFIGDELSVSLKLLGISWIAAQLAASQEGLSSVRTYPLFYIEDTWMQIFNFK